MLAIELAKQVEFGPLIGGGQSGGSVEVHDRRRAVAEERALVGRRQEAVAPDARAADRGPATVAQHDETRQVVVLAPEVRR